MECSLQLRYMQQYQQRMAQIAAQEAAGPQVKRQKTEAGGWQEVGATTGGWEPVTTASEAAGVKAELQLVKQVINCYCSCLIHASNRVPPLLDLHWLVFGWSVGMPRLTTLMLVFDVPGDGSCTSCPKYS